MISVWNLDEKNPRTARTRSSARVTFFLALVAFVGTVALDLSLPNINCTILFSIPLLLLVGRAVHVRYLWWYVSLLILAIYTLYFVKYLVVHEHQPELIWSFRLFNRTFAAISVALLGIATQAWLYWQHERSLLTYLDKVDEDEVNSTAGLVGCIGSGLLITAIDLMSPANFNLPILFAVPLYLASWLRERRSIWIAAAIFIGLTWVGYFVTPPPTVVGMEFSYVINRILVSGSLLVLALILDYQLRVHPMDEVQQH